MDDIDHAGGCTLDLFVQSIRASREEALRDGMIDPEEVERSAEEAIARGLDRRGRDRNESAKHR